MDATFFISKDHPSTGVEYNLVSLRESRVGVYSPGMKKAKLLAARELRKKRVVATV